MIVLRSTYERLMMEHRVLQNQHSTLTSQWNALVRRINEKGGTAFLDGHSSQLSADDIKRLLMLCHPDKHDGKPAAVEMTQKLLKLRG